MGVVILILNLIGVFLIFEKIDSQFLEKAEETETLINDKKISKNSEIKLD
jgi:hypothetical protein